jgi:hypothetical protein
MPRMRSLVPTVLAVLVMASAAVDRAASAGTDCLAGPNADAPQGKHWYYRLDHAAHRKCWYLGPKGARVVRRAVPTTRHATAQRAASAQQVAPPAPPSIETAAVVPPAAAAETVPDGAFVSRWADAADAIAPAPDDVEQATRVSGRIAERPEPTMDERASAQAVRQAAPAAAISERTALRAVLAGVALLLAALGVILIRAARRALRRLGEVATPASIGIRRGRHEVTAQAVTDAEDPHSAAFMSATLAPGIAAAALPPDIDPMSPGAIDAMPGVEQSLEQLRRVRERLAA